MTFALTVPNMCSRHWLIPTFDPLFTWVFTGMTCRNKIKYCTPRKSTKMEGWNMWTALQTFPRQESWDCQNLIRREVDRAGLVGPDGAIRMRGEPGSLLWNIHKNRHLWFTKNPVKHRPKCYQEKRWEERKKQIKLINKYLPVCCGTEPLQLDPRDVLVTARGPLHLQLRSWQMTSVASCQSGTAASQSGRKRWKHHY